MLAGDARLRDRIRQLEADLLALTDLKSQQLASADATTARLQGELTAALGRLHATRDERDAQALTLARREAEAGELRSHAASLAARLEEQERAARRDQDALLTRLQRQAEEAATALAAARADTESARGRWLAEKSASETAAQDLRSKHVRRALRGRETCLGCGCRFRAFRWAF